MWTLFEHAPWTLSRDPRPGHTAVILTFVLLMAGTQAAALPTTMTYQGRLTDPAGSPPPAGNFNMTFRVFANPTGGSPIWQEPHNNLTGPVPVDQLGLFEVLLGRDSALTSQHFPDGQERYLEVEVAGEVLVPRKPLNSVPYAFAAALGSQLWQTDGTNVYRAAGNVGIGTITPTYPLTVNGTVEMLPQGIGATAYLRLIPSPGGGEATAIQSGGNTPATDISFRPAGFEEVRITTNGRVGIGTASPTEKLQVTGIVHSTTGGFKFPDGTTQVTAAAAASGLGNTSARTAGTTYQAATDGFVVGNTNATSINNGFHLFSDSSPSPSTLVQRGYVLWVSGGPNVKSAFFYPVKRGDYYLVQGLIGNGPSVDNSVIDNYRFIALGN